jgi:hypothetical protein
MKNKELLTMDREWILQEGQKQFDRLAARL